MIFTQSLKKNYQFRYVYNKGKSIANKYLVIYVIKSKTNQDSTNQNRLGISVSKKVGNSVVRSRVTRLIRETYRFNEKYIKSGYDIVIIARNSTNGALYSEINSALRHLLHKHKLFLNSKYKES